MTRCYACGGSGEVSPEDVTWMREWGKQDGTPVVAREDKAKTKRMTSTVVRPTTRLAKVAPPPPAPVRGKSELHQDAAQGYTNRVRALLEQGADPNARDDDGRTPLHWPAFRGYTEIVEALLAAGADPSVQDSKDRTPLDLAKINKHERVMALLEEAMAKR